MRPANLVFDEAEAASIIEAHVARIVELITNSAQHMAAKLNGAVYLVGSTLHNPQPRDCDIRVVVDDHEFGPRFRLVSKPTERAGYTHCIAWDEDGPTQRWIDDCAKTGAEWSRVLSLNVDYKIWPKSYWREPYPKPVLLAAPSPRSWFYNVYAPDPAAARREAEAPHE